ncbi:hypothetical protein C6341_g17368 [Phytophthora cactorum]|uniref:Uncharacterized protein n=2 Tax=Phytophthora cactorum TaxID=29920 RepID=A0A8T1BCA7_9STRA|nr:hypothetical protein PC117_g21900 [Phytophthora cactorum]KAG3063065.1 hypothetical protein PC122_g19006 [Phytophthora cactorum]KAG3148557.1 hypothetical protein C6341_g17368 [Phytophthora cactorum]
MESTGEMLCMEHIVELRDSHALEFCAHPSDEYKTYAEDKKPRRQKLRNNTGSLRFVGGGVIAEQDVQGGGDEDLIDTKEAKDLADRIRQLFVGGFIAVIIAKFPPLLRIEIIRDFFQIAGLFFEGLYDLGYVRYAKTKLTTIFLTVILTLYLPRTQLAFNVLVVTHDKYDHGSAAKNRPNGSLEDEEYTYDLDGEKVAFGDKVYTELVSSDPIQLGCPFRSLYAGFERNWSIYKVLQTIAKIILALIVVAAAKSVKTSGLLISICYFFVGVLSKYSQPFIVPVDDLVELISKITALTTAAGATAVAYVSQAAKTSSTAVVHVNCFMGFVVIVHCLNMAAMVLALAMGVSASRGLIKSCLGWLLFSDTLRGFEDGRAKNIIPHWNVDKEAKHRVWQSFLRAILLELAVSSEASDIGN